MVIIKNGSISSLCIELTNKRLVCFGCGQQAEIDFNLFSEYKIQDKIDFFLDNNPCLWGKKKILFNREYNIFSLNKGKELLKTGKYVLLITNYFNYMDIICQMDSLEELNGTSVYVSCQLYEDYVLQTNKAFDNHTVSEIPKIIHYCWFGNNNMSELNLRCIESWKKYCPDYKIICWNENNFNIAHNEYTKQAYSNKKWAFVSDVARLYAVKQHGGIYLDCDVELLRPLDLLLQNDMYCGFENHRMINLGLGFGARREHPYLIKLLNFYDTLQFIRSDKSLNILPCPYYQTFIAKQFGLKLKSCFQKTEYITFYPKETFSPISYFGDEGFSNETYSIHHYAESWINENRKQYMKNSLAFYKGRVCYDT